VVLAVMSCVLGFGSGAPVFAGPQDSAPAPGPARQTPTEALYLAACAACHGADGAGVAQSTIGFDTPVPDFTDCSFATREPDADWFAIGHQGGPVRAFDRRMPAFGEVLSAGDLQLTLDHIRTFCGDRAWPRGELNLPRALVTEKAYPEDEVVLSMSVSHGSVGHEFLYEKRFGARSQVELVIPVEIAEQEGRGWQRGLGDVAVAVKHALFHSLESGRILSASAEVVFPTGKETEGLGKGVTVFEPFVTFGQIIGADNFLQAQVGLEVPANQDRAGNEAFWRLAVGRSLVEGAFGRTWSPMVEVLGARELGSGHSTIWDVVPQVQITLNRRQHVMMNVGVRVPVNERSGRHAAFLTYFLWDWFDGGLFDGWR
jgi:hypothetical protein